MKHQKLSKNLKSSISFCKLLTSICWLPGHALLARLTGLGRHLVIGGVLGGHGEGWGRSTLSTLDVGTRHSWLGSHGPLVLKVGVNCQDVQRGFDDYTHRT